MTSGPGWEMARNRDYRWMTWRDKDNEPDCEASTSLAGLLDARGPKWCRDNLTKAVRWIVMEAERHESKADPLEARKLLEEAIETYEEKVRGRKTGGKAVALAEMERLEAVMVKIYDTARQCGCVKCKEISKLCEGAMPWFA